MGRRETIRYLTGRPLTDRQIQLAVLAEIARDGRFKPAEIGVEVDEGVVTLTGTVSSYLKISDASDVAAAVVGVRDVANKLTVEGASSVRDDTRIARDVRAALTQDSDVPQERLESIVRNGVVVLKGTVDRWRQRTCAVEAVKRVNGVTSVADHISIVIPARTDRELQDEIRSAIVRRFPFQEINLVVQDADVILTGAVSSYRIRREAEDLAWSATGVRRVANKLRVGD